MTVAPSATTVNATYVGRTLIVNGRPIPAARLNPLPRCFATARPFRLAAWLAEPIPIARGVWITGLLGICPDLGPIMGMLAGAGDAC